MCKGDKVKRPRGRRHIKYYYALVTITFLHSPKTIKMAMFQHNTSSKTEALFSTDSMETHLRNKYEDVNNIFFDSVTEISKESYMKEFKKNKKES